MSGSVDAIEMTLSLNYMSHICDWDDSLLDSFSQLHVAHQMAFKTPCNRCYVDTIGRHNVSHLTCVMSTQCVVLDMAFFYKLHVTCRTWEGLYRTPPNRCYVDRLCRTLHVAHEMAFTGYVLNVAHQMAFIELPPMCCVDTYTPPSHQMAFIELPPMCVV